MRYSPIDSTLVNARPEIELLICCARTRLGTDITERIISLVKGNIDWIYLVKVAGQHGMLSLLYWNLNSACPDNIPKDILEQLSHRFHVSTRRNLILTRELLEIVKLFERHQIPIIPYKGPVLALSAYGNIALRQFLDLDFLLHKRDFPQMQELLNSRGYEQHFHSAKETLEYAYKFVRDDNHVVLEMHWDVIPPYYALTVDVEHMWDRLVLLDIGGSKIKVPSGEDLLLILCLHGYKHRWERLEWICCVAELMHNSHAINWVWLTTQAKKLGIQRILFLGLFLAFKLLGAPLPPFILQKIQINTVVQSLAAEVYESLFADVEQANNMLKFFQLRTRERLRDKVHYCFRLMLSPSQIDWKLLS